MEGQNKVPATRLTPLLFSTPHALRSLSAPSEEQRVDTDLHKRLQRRQYSPGHRQYNPQAMRPALNELRSTLEANLGVKPGTNTQSNSLQREYRLSRPPLPYRGQPGSPAAGATSSPGRASRAAPRGGRPCLPRRLRAGRCPLPPAPWACARGGGTSPLSEVEPKGWRRSGGSAGAAAPPPPGNSRPFPRAHQRRQAAARRDGAPSAPVETGFGWQRRRPAVPPRPRPSRRLMGTRVPAGRRPPRSVEAAGGEGTTAPRVPCGDGPTRRAVAVATALRRGPGRWCSEASGAGARGPAAARSFSRPFEGGSEAALRRAERVGLGLPALQGATRCVSWREEPWFSFIISNLKKSMTC